MMKEQRRPESDQELDGAARGKDNVPREIETRNAADGVHVHVHRVDAPPVATSERTCERVWGIPELEWFPFLQRAKIAYRRVRDLHVALTVDVERAIAEGAERRPGPARGTRP